MRTRFLILTAAVGGLFFFGCRSESSKQSTPQTTTVPAENPPGVRPELFLYVTLVDNLRLRGAPNQNAAVLTQFKEGSIQEGTGETSSNKETIELRGIPVEAPYCRINAAASGQATSGWVFGGALASLYAGPRSGCPDTARLGPFSRFLVGLNVRDINSGGKAWNYVEKNLADSRGSLADAVFILLGRFLNRMETEGTFYQLTDKIAWSDTDMQAIYEGKYDVNKNPVTKSLAVNGFCLATAEGSVFPVVDQNKLQAFFNARASAAMLDFLGERAQEQADPMMDDGGVLIPLEKVADIAAFWENFNRTNPYFPLQDETKESERWMRLLLVTGSDNTPVFDYETDGISGDFKHVWAYIQQKYPDSALGKLTKQMADLCAAEGWKRTKKVEDFQNSLNAQIVTGE